MYLPPVPEGVSAGCDRREALQGDCFELIFPISAWKGKPCSLCRHPERPEAAAEAEAGPSQAAIAAISGLMPTMFMTRVRL